MPFYLYIIMPALVFPLWNWIFLGFIPKASLYIYESGLVFSTKTKLYTWRWEEMNKLFESVYVNQHTRYGEYAFRIENASGESILFYGFLENPDQVFAEICYQVYPLLLKKYQVQLEAGQTIEFGTISIKKTGLYIKNEFFYWSEITRLVLLPNAVLCIEPCRDRSFRNFYLRTAEIPNLKLLEYFAESEMQK